MPRLPVGIVDTRQLTAAGYGQLARRLGQSPHNQIFLSGPPGAGKSTLFAALAEQVGEQKFLIDGDPLWYSFRDRTCLPPHVTDTLPKKFQFKAPWRFFNSQELGDYLEQFDRHLQNEAWHTMGSGWQWSNPNSEQAVAYAGALQNALANWGKIKVEALEQIRLNPFLTALFLHLFCRPPFVLDYMLDLQTVLFFRQIQETPCPQNPAKLPKPLFLWLTADQSTVQARNRDRAAATGIDDMGFRFQAVQQNFLYVYKAAQQTGLIEAVQLNI